MIYRSKISLCICLWVCVSLSWLKKGNKSEKNWILNVELYMVIANELRFDTEVCINKINIFAEFQLNVTRFKKFSLFFQFREDWQIRKLYNLISCNTYLLLYTYLDTSIPDDFLFIGYGYRPTCIFFSFNNWCIPIIFGVISEPWSMVWFKYCLSLKIKKKFN